jgi:hypothetical protein
MGNETLIAATTMIVSAAALLGVLTLFWMAKREAAALDRRVCSDRRDTVAAVELLRASIGRLEVEVAGLRLDPAHSPSAPIPIAAGRSMNLNKRTQALRMHRRGEALETIAAALGIPSREVELLVKVQEVVRYGAGASA